MFDDIVNIALQDEKNVLLHGVRQRRQKCAEYDQFHFQLSLMILTVRTIENEIQIHTKQMNSLISIASAYYLHSELLGHLEDARSFLNPLQQLLDRKRTQH